VIHQPHVHIHRLHVGIIQVPLILTPSEWKSRSGSSTSFLYCMKCWTPHPLHMKLPAVCSRCDHVMTIVRRVSRQEIMDGLLEMMMKKAHEEICEQMDAQILSELDASLKRAEEYWRAT